MKAHPKVKNLTAQASEAMKEAFAKMDANGDGVVDVEEFRAAMVQTGLQGDELENCVEIFSAMDEDGDGQMTLAEAAEAEKGGDQAGSECPRGDNLSRMLAKMALSREEKAARKAALADLADSVDALLNHIQDKATPLPTPSTPSPSPL